MSYELDVKIFTHNSDEGVGAVDVQDPNIESGEQVAERIRMHHWLAPEQTLITSSCGFNHLPRHVALGKLRANDCGKSHFEQRLVMIRRLSRHSSKMTDTAWSRSPIRGSDPHS